MLTDGVVTLTPPQLTDAEAMTATVRASLETLAVWMPWATPDYSATNSRQWLEEVAIANTYSFVIRDPANTIIGSCGLQRIDGFNRCIELGYWIGSAHTGNGYATRAARLAIAYAFEDLAYHRVEILIRCTTAQANGSPNASKPISTPPCPSGSSTTAPGTTRTCTRSSAPR